MLKQIESDIRYEQINFDELSAVALVEYIENTQHTSLKQALTATEKLIDKALTLDETHHTSLLEANRLFDKFKEELDDAIEKDDEELFPMIKTYGYKKTDDLLQNVIARLQETESDLDKIVNLLTRLRMITNGYRIPVETNASTLSTFENLRSIEKDLFRYTDLLKNVLFRQLKLGVYGQPKMA